MALRCWVLMTKVLYPMVNKMLIGWRSHEYILPNFLCLLVYVDVQVEDIVRAAKRACYRSVQVAATGWFYQQVLKFFHVLVSSLVPLLDVTKNIFPQISTIKQQKEIASTEYWFHSWIRLCLKDSDVCMMLPKFSGITDALHFFPFSAHLGGSSCLITWITMTQGRKFCVLLGLFWEITKSTFWIHYRVSFSFPRTTCSKV